MAVNLQSKVIDREGRFRKHDWQLPLENQGPFSDNLQWVVLSL